MTAKIDWYREVLELEPNSKVFFPLARLLAEDGQVSEAVAILEHGLNRHPEFLEARLCLIEILFKNSMKEKCEAEIAKLNKVFTSYAGFWHAWAACLASDQAQADTASLLRFLAAQFVAGPLQLHEVLNKGLDVIMREGQTAAPAQAVAAQPANTAGESASGPEAVAAADVATPAAAETPLAAFNAHTEEMLDDLDAELEQSAVAESAAGVEEQPLQETATAMSAEPLDSVAAVVATEDVIEEEHPAAVADLAVEEPLTASVDAAESLASGQPLGSDLIEEPALAAEAMLDMPAGEPEAALPEAEPEAADLPMVEETAAAGAPDGGEEDFIEVDTYQAVNEAAVEDALPEAPAEDPEALPVVEELSLPDIPEEPAETVGASLADSESPDMAEAAAVTAEAPDLEELSLPEPPAEELPAVEDGGMPVMEAEAEDAPVAPRRSGNTISQAAEEAEQALVNGLDLPDMEPVAQAEGDAEPLLDEFAEEEPFTLRTRSMAEVLAEQGDLKGALDIYQELAAQATSADELNDINQRVATLKSRLEMANASTGFEARDEVSQARSKEKLLNMLEALAQRVEARAQ